MFSASGLCIHMVTAPRAMRACPHKQTTQVFDALDASWSDFYLKALGYMQRVHVAKPGEDVIVPTKMGLGSMVRGSGWRRMQCSASVFGDLSPTVIGPTPYWWAPLAHRVPWVLALHAPPVTGNRGFSVKL